MIAPAAVIIILGWNPGAKCFAVFCCTLTIFGVTDLCYDLKNIPDLTKYTAGSKYPVFMFISTMGIFGGAIMFGRPYWGLFISIISVIVTIIVFVVLPGLIDFIEKMTLPFIIASMAMEFFYNGCIYGEYDS